MTNLEIEVGKDSLQRLLGSAAKNADVILAALLLEASDCISVKDTEGRYLIINPAGVHFLGLEHDDIIGKTDFDLFAKEAALKIRETDEQVMQTGQTKLFEGLLSPLYGEQRYFQAMKCVYKTPNGTVQGIINVTRDITEWKLAELALE